jgi:hypothetical protein
MVGTQEANGYYQMSRNGRLMVIRRTASSCRCRSVGVGCDVPCGRHRVARCWRSNPLQPYQSARRTVQLS